MKSLKRVAALGLVLALSAGQQAWAAQQQEEDSVYRWGRWAVLSPAAGGDSYEGQVTPDAANNARPGEASEFQPEVASVALPPIPPGLPPSLEPNPPGAQPPSGDPRDGLLPTPPVAISNPPGAQPPSGDPRDGLLPPP